jgi:hypothetical protein
MDYILELDDVLTKEFCKDVISRFEKDENKIPGATMRGVDENIKKSTDLAISVHDNRKNWQDVIDKVCDCIQYGLKKYKDYTHEEGLDRCGSVETYINQTCIGLPQIQKTEKDGFYIWHHDGSLNRVLTYIIYLNDVEEGTGGTTEFLNRGHIQPKAGKLVIFPANFAYIHRGVKLRKGVKYIITNFIWDGSPIHVHPDESVSNVVNPNPGLKSINEVNEEPENDDI